MVTPDYAQIRYKLTSEHLPTHSSPCSVHTNLQVVGLASHDTQLHFEPYKGNPPYLDPKLFQTLIRSYTPPPHSNLESPTAGLVMVRRPFCKDWNDFEICLHEYVNYWFGGRKPWYAG